ncbi:hypothetical protein [Streptomyces rishiriensis]|uniref:hypothetical protein n=1 Tax=Streptomyces rishiriensis TaxID=68264 RepID=UPI00131F1A3A
MVLLDDAGVLRYAPPEPDPRDITTDQIAGMPEGAAHVVVKLVEYEAKESPETVCARDADKPECLIQGIEYRDQGYAHAQRWIDNSRGSDRDGVGSETRRRCSADHIAELAARDPRRAEKLTRAELMPTPVPSGV